LSRKPELEQPFGIITGIAALAVIPRGHRNIVMMYSAC
jgi:hypothetical protein